MTQWTNQRRRAKSTVPAQHSSLFGLEVLEQWVRIVSIDIDLRIHIERDLVVRLSELLDLSLRTGLLQKNRANYAA